MAASIANGCHVGGGEYIGNFTQNLSKKKGSIDLVGFIPQSSKIMMTVWFESGPPPHAPLLHIDLLPAGEIRINDTQVVGTFKFDHLVGFFITFDLTGSSPNAEILISGGGNNASLSVPINSPNSANFGPGPCANRRSVRRRKCSQWGIPRQRSHRDHAQLTRRHG